MVSIVQPDIPNSAYTCQVRKLQADWGSLIENISNDVTPELCVVRYWLSASREGFRGTGVFPGCMVYSLVGLGIARFGSSDGTRVSNFNWFWWFWGLTLLCRTLGLANHSRLFWPGNASVPDSGSQTKKHPSAKHHRETMRIHRKTIGKPSGK